MDIQNEEYDEEHRDLIGRYVRYTGNDRYILRGQTRIGVITDCYTTEQYDDEDEEDYEVLILCIKINENYFEVETDYIEFISPEELEAAKDQEKREAHADKYL